MKELKRGIFLALLGAVLLVFLATDVRAQWTPDGVALCDTTGDQESPTVVSDGEGGAIVTWQDYRSGTDFDIYAQRVNASGKVRWTTDGVALCTATGNQSYPKIISDGAGGAIVTWYDGRPGTNWDIYAQRVDASGTVQWVTDGVPLCIATGNQYTPTIVSDGAGGAIVTWYDYRSGSANSDIYAQRLDALGAVQWTTDGVALCTATGNQLDPTIVSDGAGGAIVTWHDGRPGTNSDIYARRVTASGTVVWTSDGVALCTATGDQEYPKIVSDGGGGAIVTWRDLRTGAGNGDIYAQRVDGSGAVPWTTDGVALCTAGGHQYDPMIVSDSAGGAIVTWWDLRGGANADIYAQRADASGAIQWTTNGVALCTATGVQWDPTIASDGEGGAIVTWYDSRPSITNKDIYAQRVDASGAIRWMANGLALCTATEDQIYPTIASDGEGGAIVTWQDNRSGNHEIYAQRVTRQGYNYWYAAPSITSIQDVPGDQGGQVRVSFAQSRLDAWPDLAISHYSIWRALSPSAALAMKSRGISLPSPSQATPDLVGRAYYSSSGGDWELVGTLEAHLWSEYGYTVATLRDSTSVDPGWEYYCVSAHGNETFDFWDSAPDSGYSVDNLSPAAPAALAAEYIGGSELYIHWNPNMEVDLHHYAIYRGTSPDFAPDEISRMGTTTDSSFVDEDFGYEEYYYKVSAIDVHKNESPFALLTPDMITGIPNGGRDYANVLFQNAPNPFLSSTRIAFSMKEEGHVRLTVFDVKGRLVRVLANEARQSNHYVEQWDGRDNNGRPVPAGMYFYSLQAPGWKSSKKMTLAR